MKKVFILLTALLSVGVINASMNYTKPQKVLVAAELVAASSGIGYMISNARNFGQMDVVIIGMISIGVVGKVMDEILKQIEKRVLKWNN